MSPKGPGPWFPTGEVSREDGSDGWSRAVAGEPGKCGEFPLALWSLPHKLVPPELWHHCVIPEISRSWAFGATAEHCHAHSYCCVDFVDPAALQHRCSASVHKCCCSLGAEGES